MDRAAIGIREHSDRFNNLTVVTLARMKAVKAVKRGMQRRGLKPANVARKVIVAEANAYLRDHPELLDQAADMIDQCPELRRLSDRMERGRAKLRSGASGVKP